jgi:hypothetical protein
VSGTPGGRADQAASGSLPPWRPMMLGAANNRTRSSPGQRTSRLGLAAPHLAVSRTDGPECRTAAAEVVSQQMADSLR